MVVHERAAQYPLKANHLHRKIPVTPGNGWRDAGLVSDYNIPMSSPLGRKFTLSDLRAARTSGRKIAMLTCYDFTTARLMQEGGVPMLLAGDSAANVILGYDTTLPVSLEFMIEITAAVRRGAQQCYLVADMPFGSYGSTLLHWVENVYRMVKLSGCDCVKIEVAAGHAELVKTLADAGVAVMAHLGLRPQSVGIMGGYRFQARTAIEADNVVALAQLMQKSGAAALLLEAVPPEVSARVVEQTAIPVIGCGAGPACHGHVIVTHDALGLTAHRPKFAPLLADFSEPLKKAFARYVHNIETGEYPAIEHQYEMPHDERKSFQRSAGENQALTIS
jgi:3-methyl-2-oxobutanoate hydroxymethyltransferase